MTAVTLWDKRRSLELGEQRHCGTKGEILELRVRIHCGIKGRNLEVEEYRGTEGRNKIKTVLAVGAGGELECSFIIF